MSDYSKLSGWNYRVIKHDEGNGEFAIHEVYYAEENGESIPVAYTKNSVSPMGEDYEELKKDMSYYFSALDKSTLKQSNIGSDESSNLEEESE